MTHQENFRKWMASIEESLLGDAQPQSPQNQQETCGCLSWNCPVCFPDAGEQPAQQSAIIIISGDEDMESQCPTCGATHDDCGEDMLQPNMISDDDMINTGDESPLTYGSENLEEESTTSPDEMIESILYMQDLGLSKSDRVYPEEELLTMSPEELQDCYERTTGESMSGAPEEYTSDEITADADANLEVPMMEDMGADIVAWLGRFNDYDKMHRANLGEAAPDKKDVPAFLRKEKGGDWKVTTDDLEKEKDSRISDAKTLAKNSGKQVDESVDTDILDWMARFAKLGNMKGYGR